MQRLVNAAVALAVTLVAYQAYLLGVVPIVEPAVATRPYDPATEDDWRGPDAIGRYQLLLASYLPPDHWALRGTPQVYEYGQLLLVLDDFRPLDRSRIEINRSVLVAFPTPRSPGVAPPRDAILVEVDNPARIQFDEAQGGFDLAAGRVGRPIAGEFAGEVVVRSDMNEPGPQDDLRVVTRDLRFNQALITTNAEVDLRLGPHRARGRVLEVRLLVDPHAPSDETAVTGIESLELREEVVALIDAASLNLPKGGPAAAATRSGAPHAVRLAVAVEDSPTGEGPLRVSSAGPFRFDFTRFIASLQDDVRAALPQPDGSIDQMLCRELRMHFGDRRGTATELDPADEPDLARRQGRLLSDLTPRLVEAVGAPVRIDSPTRAAALRGRRVRVWVNDRRLRVEGAPATMVQGLSETHAPAIEYVAPPDGADLAVGELLAAGPGWLRVTPRADEPQQSYQARWSEVAAGEPAVTLRRDPRGTPTLTLVGRPEFAATGLGKFRADSVAVQLVEVPPDGRDGPAIELGGDGPRSAILVRRIDALGGVEFVGREIDGRAETLTALVRPVETPVPSAPADATQAAPASFAANDETDRGPAERRYKLLTKSIQLDVGLFGRRSAPLAMVCDGGVRLEELPRPGEADPLLVVGEQLRADRLERRGGARLTLAGAADGANGEGTVGLAEVRAAGLRVWVRDLHLDQAAGRAWTEGRGDARVRLPAGDGTDPFSGEATLRWRGGMQFDGARLALSDEVFAETTGGWLNCAKLTATLSQPIDLTRGSPSGAIDVEVVECSGGVTVDYRSSDDQGPVSHERAKTGSIAVNRRSGAISGAGPGSIRSVRLASAGAGPLSSGGAGAGLRFLRVDFRQGIAGNYLDRRVQFLGGVEAVYGPVLAWDHRLPLHSPEGTPPDTAEIRCEELRVLEDPAASVQRGSAAAGPIGPIELVALRGVRIDASIGAEGGGLVAEAGRASYSQAADRFILEGDGQQLARLWARSTGQQPYAPATAQRLTHYLTLGRTTVDDLRGAEYQPPPSARVPTATPR